jgi:hypothetical protein
MLEREAGRNVALATVHSALYGLERKGYVRSHVGGATEERGARCKEIGIRKVLALVTISYQVLKAGLSNPVDALRYE